jgi:integrase
MAATEPIRDRQQVKQLTEYYLGKEQIRNHVLIIMGVYTALRVSDLLRLRWNDVYDFRRRRVRDRIQLTEQKTGKSKIIALNRDAVSALSQYAAQKDIHPDMFIMENPRTHKAISRVQAFRIIRAAASDLNIGRVSCHSLRKTFGYHAWKNGVALAVIMEIFNHSSYAVTRRYLGITQDDKNEAYLGLDFSAQPSSEPVSAAGVIPTKPSLFSRICDLCIILSRKICIVNHFCKI